MGYIKRLQHLGNIFNGLVKKRFFKNSSAGDSHYRVYDILQHTGLQGENIQWGTRVIIAGFSKFS